MKYDDASWHSGGDFPSDSPPEYGGTHIGLFLKWCILRNLIGEIHLEESQADLAGVRDGSMSGTDFLFKNCDGKFTDEDISDTGNRFAADYYQEYLGDYGQMFPEQMYCVGESEHDFDELAKHLDYCFKVYSGRWKE